MNDIIIAIDCGIYNPGDIESNYESMMRSIESAKMNHCDIVCFPEACLSGYSTKECGPIDERSLRNIVELSDGITIVFGAFEGDDDLYIVQYVCEDGKIIGRYRKTHLGMNETRFSPGDSLPVFRLKDITIGIQICWELHFPQITATYRSKGAALVLNPFASGLPPERRVSLWKKIIPARADDNRIFYAACNCDGSSTICYGPNGSELIGKSIGEHLVMYTLDHCLLERYRDQVETMSNIDYPKHFRPELYDLE